MTKSEIELTVFTKPWRLSLPELAQRVSGWGFNGVELPVRPGYPVTPENVAQMLPEAVAILADHGVKIGSIAGPTDEATLAACGACGIPIVRICVSIPGEKNYLDAIENLQREWDALISLLDENKVALGIQNHYGRFIANAAQMRHAIGQYDPRHVCAVWDAAHNGLEGEQVDLALDTVWSHLRLVNLKSSFWQRINGPEAAAAEWHTYWTTGRHGRTNWPWVVNELLKRGYRGDICLTAEYTDEEKVDHYIAEDIAFAKQLLAREG